MTETLARLLTIESWYPENHPFLILKEAFSYMQMHIDVNYPPPDLNGARLLNPLLFEITQQRLPDPCHFSLQCVTDLLKGLLGLSTPVETRRAARSKRTLK